MDNLVLYKEAKHWAYREQKEVAFLRLDSAKAFDNWNDTIWMQFSMLKLVP